MDASSSDKNRSPWSRMMIFGVKSFALASVIAALIIGGWFGVTKGRTLWKNTRTANLSDEVEAMIKSEQWDSAVPTLSRAYAEAPRDPKVLRMIARFCDRFPSQSEDATHFWRSLMDSGEATAEDRTYYAAAALRVGDVETAGKMIASLTGADLETRVALETRAGILDREGKGDQAMLLHRRVWAESPDDPECKLRLAEADLKSTFAEMRHSAKLNLLELARAGGKVSGPALLALAVGASLNEAECVEAIALIDTAGTMAERQRYAIIDGCVSQSRSPEVARRVVDAEVARVKSKKPGDGGGACFEWLASHGQTQTILECIDEAEAMKSRELLLPYADALMRSAQWKQLDAILAQNKLPLSPVDRELLAAYHTRSQAGTTESIRAQLRSALTRALATNHPAQVIQVINAAESLGQTEIAIDACTRLAASRALRLQMLARIYTLQRTLSDTRGMSATATAILDMRPGLQPYADAERYLRLILGLDLEVVLDEIQLEASIPAPTPQRMLNQALAAYHAGDVESAMTHLSRTTAADLDPGPRAVFAGLLHFSGKPAEAYRAAERISSTGVLPEEQIFLQAALR